MIITIDGPACSGKSTVARSLAKKLNFYYLNTGLLYRAVAYLLINQCAYEQNALRNADQADLNNLIDKNRLIYEYDQDASEQVIFDGQDITPFLRTSFIDEGASIVSTNIMVRDLLLKIQRVAAQKFDLVADGRDAGSVVFPEADVKIYLTASEKVRAERWRAEQERNGNTFSEDESRNIINDRDKRDKEREVAPLIIPDDAIFLDNSKLDMKETLDQIIEFIEKAKIV